MMEPTDKLSVELEAQQWNQLLQLLHEVAAPLRVTQPLVQAIMQQCNPQSASPQAGNGALNEEMTRAN
jgi:hypothetical protein